MSGRSAFRRIFVAGALTVVVAFAADPVGAQPQRPSAAESRQIYAFVFRDADLASVAEEVLGKALGVSYVVDPAVSAKISFRVDQSMTKLQLLETFETTLATYDVVLVRNGESFTLTSRTKARAAGALGGGGSSPGGYSVSTIPLTSAKPSEVVSGLKAMGATDIVVFADDATGVLMLGGTGRELESARQAIAALDRRTAALNRWIELKNTSAEVMARDLADILPAMNLSSVKVAPISRLRGLMIFAPSNQSLDEVASLVARLDVTSADGEGSLWYYRPSNVAAESLSATLNRVLGNTGLEAEQAAPSSSPEPSPALGSSSSSASPPPAFGARRPPLQSGVMRAESVASPMASAGEDQVRIAVDKESNTLVISSPPYRKAELQKLLGELDVRPRQVLIEASVLEVGLSDEFRLGVDWSVINGRTVATFSGDPSGAVAPIFPGIGVTYLSGDIRAAIDALGSRTVVEVVSSPKIMVLDNRSARLQIGDQVPVAIQTSQSNVTDDAPRLVSIEYRNTGVILDVTPRVTGDGTVTLLIAQEVSSVAKTTTSGIDSPTIQQRRFDSSLLLNSGGTVALGGLISSTKSNGAAGVPFLSDIPFLGTLFKNETADTRRTELIVLLSATILSDPEASAAAAKNLSSRLKEVEGRGLVPN